MALLCQHQGDGDQEKLLLVLHQGRIVSSLDEIVRQQSAKAFDFGDCNTLNVAQAASAKGLVECQHWLRGILRVCVMALPKAIH